MDELMLSGKRYISSRRIARENGYTSDYIGQLIRGGKIVGQKVGRAWYVDAASFDAYLNGEGAPATASVIPAVEEKAEMISSEPVVEEIVEEAAPELKEEVAEEKIIEEEVEEKEAAIKIEIKKEAPAHAPLHVYVKEEPTPGGLRYYADDAPSLPTIKTMHSEIPVHAPSAVVAQKRVSVRGNLPVALALVGVVVLVGAAALSTVTSFNLHLEAGNTSSAFYSIGW